MPERSQPESSLRETPTPPVPFPRQEGRPGGFGQSRHDQGRQGRGGRWRHGRGGHRYQGRDLPPSKYASPRPYSPSGGQHGEELPADYEPVILPGESLAKYKDRIPRASGTGSPGASASPTSPVEAPPPAAQKYPGAEDHESEPNSSSGKHEPEEPGPEEAWTATHEIESPSVTPD